MRINNIRALRGYDAPSRIVGRLSIIAPNHVQRTFTVEHPDRAPVTDITYVRLAGLAVYVRGHGLVCPQGRRLLDEAYPAQ